MVIWGRVDNKMSYHHTLPTSPKVGLVRTRKILSRHYSKSKNTSHVCLVSFRNLYTHKLPFTISLLKQIIVYSHCSNPKQGCWQDLDSSASDTSSHLQHSSPVSGTNISKRPETAVCLAQFPSWLSFSENCPWNKAANSRCCLRPQTSLAYGSPGQVSSGKASISYGTTFTWHSCSGQFQH